MGIKSATEINRITIHCNEIMFLKKLTLLINLSIYAHSYDKIY